MVTLIFVSFRSEMSGGIHLPELAGLAVFTYRYSRIAVMKGLWDSPARLLPVAGLATNRRIR